MRSLSGPSRFLLLTTSAFIAACSPFTAGSGPSPDADRIALVRGPGEVRVATWNLESAGAPGTSEHLRALDVLAMLDADVVAVNEIQGDEDEAHFLALAQSAGYPHVIVGRDVGFGDDRNAVMSRVAFQAAWILDAPAISGDPRAKDLTRAVVAARIDTPVPVTVFASHLKSGSMAQEQYFRRMVDGQRLARAVPVAIPGFDPEQHAVVVTGDMNAEHGQPDGRSTWTSLPWGLPSSYWLGSDLYGALPNGLPGDVFAPLEALGLLVLDARQPNGSDATRPSSGRRLDHLAVSPRARPLADGVFTCPGAWSTCTGAADHLPVWVDLDLTVPEPSGGEPPPEGAGGLVFSEILANPDACPDADGEWVELRNAGSEPVDLAGLTLADAAGNSRVLGSFVVPAGGFALLGPGRCGPPVDVVVDGVSLNNGGDTLMLAGEQGALDELSYGASASGAGVAWQVGADGSCAAGAGTPGAVNPPC